MKHPHLKVVPIRDARPGLLVKVHGRIRAAAELIAAPFSGTRAVAYQTVVLGSPSAGLTDRVQEEASAIDLLVDDGTGTILVRAADGAEIALAADRRFGWRECATRLRRQPLLQRARALELPDGSIYAWEGFLEEGAVAEVAGWCHLEPDPNPPGETAGYRDTPGMRPVLIAPPDGRLWITNQLVDGGPRMKR